MIYDFEQKFRFLMVKFYFPNEIIISTHFSVFGKKLNFRPLLRFSAKKIRFFDQNF